MENKKLYYLYEDPLGQLVLFDFKFVTSMNYLLINIFDDISELIQTLIFNYNYTRESASDFIETQLKNNINLKTKVNVDYTTAKNQPIVMNGVPIGIIKEYHSNGVIECIIWDKYISVEQNKDSLNINAIII